VVGVHHFEAHVTNAALGSSLRCDLNHLWRHVDSQRLSGRFPHPGGGEARVADFTRYVEHSVLGLTLPDRRATERLQTTNASSRAREAQAASLE
jgi:hypothetical protein